MNQQQRKQLAAAIADLQPYADASHCEEMGVEAVIAAAEAARGVFRDMAEEEREKFDNMPEGLQQSERGQALEEAADALESAATDLDDIADADPDIDVETGDWSDDWSDVIQSAIDNAESF